MKPDSLETCTCDGWYYSIESLPMGYTIPHTRLIDYHLNPLSYLGQGPPTIRFGKKIK